MESLSKCLSASPLFPLIFKTLKSNPKSHPSLTNYYTLCNSTSLSLTPIHQPNKTSRTTHLFSYKYFHKEQLSFLEPHQLSFKSQFSFLLLGLSLPLSSFASETATEQVPNRINLESVLVSVDNFFSRYPFFVATVTFIWLVVIPLTQQYLQKYKFISAINAFKKLKEDPESQLLDIRYGKSLAYLGSPNLKILNKSTLQVEFREGDEDGFVKRVLESLGDPANTIVCVVDNFDGNSMKVAELLVKNGFKEAYAIRGGIRGEKGWQDIQASLLPPSMHVYPKKRGKMSKELNANRGILQENRTNDELSSSASTKVNNVVKEVNNREFGASGPTLHSKGAQRPSSPYPNYPGYKPPSSPTPSKPN